MPAPTDKADSQVIRRNFPGQLFQFSALPGDVFSADPPHDAAGFCEAEFLFQPGEAAPKWNDLRFCFVHLHAKRRRFPPDHIQTSKQILFIVVDDVTIVHVAPVKLTAHPLFNFVVKPVRDGQRQILTDLATQPQTNRPKHPNQMQNQEFQPFIRNIALQNFCDSIMADTVEKFVEIVDQDVSIPSKFAVKLVQMRFQSLECVVNAFSFLTGRVIRNQPRTKNRSEQVVAEATLHHALRDMHRANVSVFSTLKNVKLNKSIAFPCAVQQFTLGHAHVDKCVLFVGLS